MGGPPTGRRRRGGQFDKALDTRGGIMLRF